LNPDPHIGARFWVGGIRDYNQKHITGASQGENVIFLGLNNNNEPLFFFIPHIGEEFFITYNELLKRLHSHYNAYPETIDNSNRKFTLKTAEKSELIELYYGSVNFAPESLTSLIDTIRKNNLKAFENFIQAYCRRFYEGSILKEGYVIKNKQYTNKMLFFRDNIVKHPQDDNDLTYQKILIKKDLKKQQEKSCKDDLDITYAYKKK